jgi:hypothetical protein
LLRSDAYVWDIAGGGVPFGIWAETPAVAVFRGSQSVQAHAEIVPQSGYERSFSIFATASLTESDADSHRRRLRVASGATAPGPALEGVPRFMPKLVHKQKKKL